MRKALLLPLFILTSCGASPSTSQTAPTNQSGPIGIVTDPNGVDSVVTGAENANGIETPKDLPAWAKIYPGGKVIAAMQDHSSAPGGTVSYVTADPLTKVAAFYDAALAAAGKKPGPTADSAEGAVRFVGKDAGDGGGMVTIAPDKQGTTVTILYKQ